MVHHLHDGGACVQVNHIVVGDEPRGVLGDAQLLRVVELTFHTHIGLLPLEFLDKLAGPGKRNRPNFCTRFFIDDVLS